MRWDRDLGSGSEKEARAQYGCDDGVLNLDMHKQPRTEKTNSFIDLSIGVD